MESLEMILSTLQVLSVVVILFIAATLIFKRRFVAAVIFMVIAPLPLLILPHFVMETSSNTINQTSNEVPEPTPAPEPAAPSEPFDWEPVLIGGGILAAVGFIVFIVSYAVKTYQKRQLMLEEKNQRDQEKAVQWNQLREVYKDSLQVIFDYETNLELALQYPAMNNSQDEYTAKMLRSAQKAKEVNAAVSSDGIGGSDELLEQYRQIVHELKEDVNLAKLNAEKMKIGFLSDDQRKDFKLAISLLNHASNEGTTEQARVNFLEKLKETIERINSRSVANLIPSKTIQAIERMEQKELTA